MNAFPQVSAIPNESHPADGLALLVLSICHPVGALAEVLLTVLRCSDPGMSLDELHALLESLGERQLLTTSFDSRGRMSVKLTAFGVELVDRRHAQFEAALLRRAALTIPA